MANLTKIQVIKLRVRDYVAENTKTYWFSIGYSLAIILVVMDFWISISENSPPPSFPEKVILSAVALIIGLPILYLSHYATEKISCYFIRLQKKIFPNV